MQFSTFDKNVAEELFDIVQTQVTENVRVRAHNGSSELLQSLKNFYECVLIEEEQVSENTYNKKDEVGTITCIVNSVANEKDLCTSVKRSMLQIIKNIPDDTSILDYASKILAYCGGETSRRESHIYLRFKLPKHCPDDYLVLRFSSPCFSAADVGNRLWASSKAFCAWMLQNPSDVLESIQPFISKHPSVVYLGCGAIPLAGMTLAGYLDAEKLILSDMNQECLDVALSNSQTNVIVRKPTIIETCKYNWNDEDGAPLGDIVIASACLYEDEHVEILPKAILRCFPDGIGRSHFPVILALHEEHPGFDKHYPDMFVYHGLKLVKTFGQVKVMEGDRLSTIRIVLMMATKNLD